MARISTFELLSKRIGPPGGIIGNYDYNNPLNAAFRRLLQGYYLTVGNFNMRKVRLQMRAVFPRIDTCETQTPFSAPERELVGGVSANHVYAFDVTGDNQTAAAPRILLGAMQEIPTFNPNSRTYTTRTFKLCTCQTGMVNLLPNPSSSGQVVPLLEIRGYVEIVQVAGFFLENGIIVFVQTAPEVDLLFTPEHRGTFLDDRFPVFAGPLPDFDFDQSIHALPTATGGAEMTIPKRSYIFPQIPIFTTIVDRDIQQFIELQGLPARIDFLGRVVLEDEGIKRITEQVERAEQIAGKPARPLRSIFQDIEYELQTLYDPKGGEEEPFPR